MYSCNMPLTSFRYSKKRLRFWKRIWGNHKREVRVSKRG